MSRREEIDVLVSGLGYVGLSFAVAAASNGFDVIGVDIDHQRVATISEGRSPFLEPGIEAGLDGSGDGSLRVTTEVPHVSTSAIVLCVGTPLKEGLRSPDLSQLTSAVDDVRGLAGPETLVIVRSTVPVGTSRHVVADSLRARVAQPLVAVCPERTIQGRAMSEIGSLPQLVGGSCPEATRRASELFSELSSAVVTLSSMEATELAKLACNSHTDVLYAFGNEIGRVAEEHGLDAREIVNAANIGYPRPDLAEPGFVGGACLSKDPWILLDGTASDTNNSVILAARQQNEDLPIAATRRVMRHLDAAVSCSAERRILVSGVAYKGTPPTDDIRGSAAKEVIRSLRQEVETVLAHDFEVDDATISTLGADPVDLDTGFTNSHAVMFLTDHPRYEDVDLARLVAKMARPAIIFDAWNVFDGIDVDEHDVLRLELGNGG